ncbi:MAG TPA: PAS domain-containing protein [Anaeromyxobacter sp.]|nr:PAS domain-containing protein [Anaeromyxobacter sp.]
MSSDPHGGRIPHPLPRIGDSLLRLLVENARDVAFRVRLGPPVTFEYVSPSVTALTGYTPDEFYRDSSLGERVVHPDDRHMLDPAKMGQEGVVLRWVARDGHVVHVEPRAVVVVNPQGQPEVVEGIIRDVSARVRAEEAVRESETRLRSVFAAMAEGVLIYDGEGRIVECNAAAERYLRQPRDELLGRASGENWHALRGDGTPFPPEEYPANRTLRTGQPVHGTLIGLVQPDGTLRWLSISAEPLRREDEGPPHGVLVSFADMTAERRAWVEVRRREAQLRLAMECAGHAFWEVDVTATSGEESAVPSPAGTRPLDAVRWLSLVHPDDKARAQVDFDAHVEGRTPAYVSEYRLPVGDGGWRWVLVSGRAVARDEAGRATRLAGTLTDITEAKRLQERLRDADRLAGVGTLAAGVAHEVNNPLAYVSANLAVLDERLVRLAGAAELDPGGDTFVGEMRQALHEAMDGAARVRGIVQGLRQFAQPLRGVERGPVDVRAEIEVALGMARNEITHRARLSVDLPDRLPPVRAAPQELGQVFVNLLVNAAQAIPEGQTAEHEVRIAARAKGQRIVIEVQDSGAGIEPAHLPHIFDPFFTTKPAGVGSGLGLSVCHGIVTALGGSIGAQSMPGRGTTFRVDLPALPDDAGPPLPRTARAPREARRGRVLVVDDEPLVGKSLARLLSAHEVTVLTSPLEALRRAAKGERWDVVLCDLMMPEMSGMDLEERLAADAPDLVSRIVYLTGGAFTERSRAFLAAGRPHLQKPVEPSELRARVAEKVEKPTGS